MNFSDLKDRLVDSLKTTWDKIQESTAYQQLIEKYEDLPSNQQRMVRLGSSLLIFLFLLSPPITSILNSQDSVFEFERKRELTRELLRAVRDTANAPSLPPGPDVFSLQSSLQEELQNGKLIPEQVFSIQAGNDPGSLIPAKLAKGSLSVSLKDLNLRQILDIAYRLSSLNSTLKMTDLEFNASPEKPGYFHFNAKLVALKTPEPIPLVNSDESSPRKGSKFGKRKRIQQEEDSEGSSEGDGE